MNTTKATPAARKGKYDSLRAEYLHSLTLDTSNLSGQFGTDGFTGVWFLLLDVYGSDYILYEADNGRVDVIGKYACYYLAPITSTPGAPQGLARSAEACNIFLTLEEEYNEEWGEFTDWVDQDEDGDQ